jgi:FKBP-type peptidyl-prolyl cis-trans isomerase
VPAELAERDGPRAGPQIVELMLVDILRGPAPRELPIAAAPPDAIVTASGLAYVRINNGSGTQHPTTDNDLLAHYAGWTTDGKQFDSSYERGEPIRFRMDQVIPGWREALALMVVGDKTRFWIPERLAYEGRPGRPQGMLVFDIELVAIEP